MTERKRAEESFLEKLLGGIIVIPMIFICTYKLYKISKYQKEQEKLYGPRNS